MRPIHNALPTLLASICLTFFVILAVHASEQETVGLKVGNGGKAPAISYMDKTGATRTLETAPYKLTALHFWATWCVPCVDELPMIDDAQEIFGPGLHIVPVALDGKNTAKIEKFFADHKIEHLPVLTDPTAKTANMAGLKGLPGTIFIDGKGNIVARADGPLDWQQEDVVGFIRGRIK